MSGRAVCARCGGSRSDLFADCPDCGASIGPADRPLAWLLSSAWLDEAELDELARRISSGQRPDPGEALLARARVALGAAPQERGERLSPRQRLGLLAANLLLTPLAGYAVWFGLRRERPAAARDALSVTLPVTMALAGAWLAMVFHR